MIAISPHEQPDVVQRQPVAPPPLPATVLVPLRLFLTIGWLRAALEKLIDVNWWDGQKLRDFLDLQHSSALPFFQPVMDHTIAPMSILVAATVLLLQIMIGVCIGSGRWMRFALAGAIILNVSFILAGRTNPSVFYIVIELTLLAAVSASGVGSRRRVATHWMMLGAFASFVGAAVMVPFVSTMELATVVNDPALVMAMLFSVTGSMLVVHTLLDRKELTHVASLRRSLERWVRADPYLGPEPRPPRGTLPPPTLDHRNRAARVVYLCALPDPYRQEVVPSTLPPPVTLERISEPM